MSSYHFFIEIIVAFGYYDLLRGLFREVQVKSLVDRIKDASSGLKAIGQLLYYMRKIEEKTARELVNETSYTYAEKINASTTPELIKRLLDSMRKIDEDTAKKLEKETKFKSKEE